MLFIMKYCVHGTLLKVSICALHMILHSGHGKLKDRRQICCAEIRRLMACWSKQDNSLNQPTNFIVKAFLEQFVVSHQVKKCSPFKEPLGLIIVLTKSAINLYHVTNSVQNLSRYFHKIYFRVIIALYLISFNISR
jgi:hypothetical protein